MKSYDCMFFHYRLIVVLINEIHVFYFPTSSTSEASTPSPKHLSTVTTSLNPRGLCEDLVCLDQEREERGGQGGSESVCTTHSHDLTAIALSPRGNMVATASTKGTIIRVHSTSSRDLVAEFRRGTDSANINCLCFSLDSEYMLCSSDKATVHIFSIKDQTLNKKLSLPAVGILSRAVSSYTESQWGLAQFSLAKEGQCVCAFSGSRSVVALCADGSCHKYTFTTDGNCSRDAFNMFLDMFDDHM
ncbi:WD repeat domain phosphoinositide-interacting protein 4 [Geodia barretti]|uniref:WD repeat domain phosphoinositide-interacting protein 4 n=1 Tax=Geodia barretti TaxID=519541 RepID=A0AA35X0E2_GEOBA|nr:WD repeat domain phosphoinositide-interacting protein 4 [Geodia barretti]